MHTYTHTHTLAATQDSTTSTGAKLGLAGKNLPHAALSGCNQPHKAYNPVGIHQIAPAERTTNKQAYYSFIDTGRMKG